MRDIGLPAGWAPRLLGLLRMVAGLLSLEHGARKPFGFPPPRMPIRFVFRSLWTAGASPRRSDSKLGVQASA